MTDPDLSAEFVEGLRRKCEELLVRGHETLRHHGNLVDDEEELTEQFIKYLRHINQTTFYERFSIHHDGRAKTKQNLNSSRHARRSQRVDIILSFVRTTGEIEYSIECKRLKTSDRELARYYWKKGVRRFVEEEYADRVSFGAMAGYVLEGSVSKNAESVGQKCADYRNRYNLQEPWEHQWELPAGQLYHSAHARPTVKDIELDHYLLDCR